MASRKTYLIIALFFALSLALRAYVAFNTDSYAYEAYDVIRNLQAITDTGRPLFQDPLSFGGRLNVFSPLYFYLLAFFSIFLSIEVVIKVLPAIFASSIVFVVYYFVLSLTKKKGIAAAASFLSIFMPIFFAETVFSASHYNLVIPLLLLSMVLFLRIGTHKYGPVSFMVMIMLILLHPSSFVLVLGLLIYLGLCTVFRLGTERKEIELSLFAMFFYVWFNFIIYKKALLSHGARIIWQNMPGSLIRGHFVSTDLLGIASMLGLFVSMLAIYSVYHSSFIIKRKSLLLVTSVVISCLLLLALKILSLKQGLIILTALFIIHAGYSLRLIYDYFNRTKISRYSVFMVLAVVFIIFINLAASLSYSLKVKDSELPSNEDIKAFEWLRRNTPEGSVVLALPEEGYAVEAISHRSTVIDHNFLLVDNADERFNDVTRVFRLRTTAESLNIFNKYLVDYVLLSFSAQQRLGISELFYSSDESCFTLLYNENSRIYKVECVVHKQLSN